MYPQNHALQPETRQKSGITHKCLNNKIKPLTFQHKNYVYCFHFQCPGRETLT